MQRLPSSESGASTVHWLVALLVLLAFGALAIDMNNLYLSRSQLQIAADAGALEGARLLYNPDGSINLGQFGGSALDGATAAAHSNLSQGVAVEVLSAERGHWEFMTTQTDADGIERGGLFTANATVTPAALFDPATGRYRSFQELNLDPNEINAVEVVAARQLTPIQAFFGPLLGFDDYQMQARAAAYIGFSGTILPGEMDAPISLCEHRLRDEFGNWSCTIGRFISSSDNDEQTAGWTDFEQPLACSGGANTSSIREAYRCGEKRNPEMLLGKEMNVIGGEVQTVFDAIYDCWRVSADTDNDGEPDMPWRLTLPVIECDDSNPGPCNKLIGATTMEVLWMVRSVNANQIDEEAPRRMGDWDSEDPSLEIDPSDGKQRWNSFVAHYEIKSAAGSEFAYWVEPPGDNGYRSKTIYFKPDCEPREAVGGSGGANFGIRAKIPVLVY